MTTPIRTTEARAIARLHYEQDLAELKEQILPARVAFEQCDGQECWVIVDDPTSPQDPQQAHKQLEALIVGSWKSALYRPNSLLDEYDHRKTLKWPTF